MATRKLPTYVCVCFPTNIGTHRIVYVLNSSVNQNQDEDEMPPQLQMTVVVDAAYERDFPLSFRTLWCRFHWKC